MSGFCICQSENYIWTQSRSTALGDGTFGNVHKGHRKETGEFVAIKVFNFPKDDENKARYMEEQDLVMQLHNDFIVRYEKMEEVINVQASKIHQILVMELGDGNVRSELQKPEHYFGLPYKLLFTIMDHCLKAFQYLDLKGIAHRDMKPDNVLIFRKPRLTCKLCDFGGACFVKYSNEMMTDAVGSSGYLNSAIATNLAAGKPLRGYTKDQHDMWASSSCFFECATGREPFIAKDEEGKYVNINELLKRRPPDIVCGERICTRLPTGEREYHNEYHQEMPLQHYSYSRSLKSVLAQFFKRVFAKDKSYLVFDVFYGLCQAVTSLESYKFYNVSDLCIDEYFDTTESKAFSRETFYDYVSGEVQMEGQAVQIMQGINTVRDVQRFQPTTDESLDKLVVWKIEGPHMIVPAQPNYEVLMLPLNVGALRHAGDIQTAVGWIVQMQLQERQMRLFHNTIISFCHSCKEAMRVLCFKDQYAERTVLETMRQFSTPETRNDYEQRLEMLDELGGYDYMDTESIPADPAELGGSPLRYTMLSGQRQISGLQRGTLKVRDVTNAQEEVSDLTEKNELFKVNCKLIVKEYTEAQRSLMETTEFVRAAMANVLATEIRTLHDLLEHLRTTELHSPERSWWQLIFHR